MAELDAEGIFVVRAWYESPSGPMTARITTRVGLLEGTSTTTVVQGIDDVCEHLRDWAHKLQSLRDKSRT